jgi:hypothetical protein
VVVPETLTPAPARAGTTADPTTVESPRVAAAGARGVELAWRLAPIVLAVLSVLAYFAIDPRVYDLPAAEFRTWLFEQQGFTIWNGEWYGGHHTPGYSILFPPLAALLGGPEEVAAVATVAAAALFEPLCRAHFGARVARVPALWFGLAAGTLLFSGRLPWALGAAFALGALLALQRGRPKLCAALTLAATLSSPVAGAFLTMFGVALVLTGRPRRGVMLAVVGLGPPLVLAGAFPEGGYQPFWFESYKIVPVVALATAALLPSREKTIRVACVLYAIGATMAHLLHTPFGGNAVRLGQLVGGPLLLAALLAARPLGWVRTVTGAVVLLMLAWWQWGPIVREVRKAHGDPSTRAAYYEPVIDFLADKDGDPWRLEVPTLQSQGESNFVARHHPLARGWERQVDIKLNGLFYEGDLTAARYRHWLGRNAVRYVALPDAELGYAARSEAKLIRAGLPYLQPVFKSEHWTIYEVTKPGRLAVPDDADGIRVTRLGSDSVDLEVTEPGSALLRVHFSPYWKLEGGCVERDGDWTRVEPGRLGATRLVMSFAPSRMLSRGRRCDG